MSDESKDRVPATAWLAANNIHNWEDLAKYVQDAGIVYNPMNVHSKFLAEGVAAELWSLPDNDYAFVGVLDEIVRDMTEVIIEMKDQFREREASKLATCSVVAGVQAVDLAMGSVVDMGIVEPSWPDLAYELSGIYCSAFEAGAGITTTRIAHAMVRFSTIDATNVHERLKLAATDLFDAYMEAADLDRELANRIQVLINHVLNSVPGN